jgi:Rieske 2Fe-2S family protein
VNASPPATGRSGEMESVATRQERVNRAEVYDRSKLKTRVDLATIIGPAQYALEREKIFRRSWLAIGHTDDLPENGSWFVYDVPTFDASLLVVRGDDGEVRVFHNACRHRANKLQRDGAGKAKLFRCQFHGWAFSTNGRLNHVTDEHMFEPIDRDLYSLTAVTSGIWENLIFVNFDPQPSETLEQWLGPEFVDQYSGYWDLHQKSATYTFDLKCNWHLAVNSFTEGYHTAYLHRNTARDYQGGKINPHRHRPSIELMQRHHRYSAPGNPDHVVLPVEDTAIRFGRKLLPAFDFDYSMLPPGVNPTRYPYWAFDVVEFFPNYVVITGNHFRTEFNFWPIDHAHTRVILRRYVYPPKNLGERISVSYFLARGRDVIREDLNTLEAQQQTLTAGAVPHVVLSKQEIALQHHFAVTQDMLEQP